MSNISGAKIIYKTLKKLGYKNSFGYSGGAVLPLLDAFYKSNSINFWTNINEQCSGHAAAGYAKSSGNTGLIVSTSGPGVTNLITPLQDAKTDGVPLLALTGQVPTGSIGTMAFQECPAVELSKGATKWSYQVNENDNLQDIIEEANNIANSSRKGPVHIDLPKDILSKNSKYSFEYKKNLNNSSFDAFDSKIIKSNILVKYNQIKELLKKAKKPVIIAGAGCQNSSEKLTKLANYLNIPVTSTLHGMGSFDENNKLSLHMLGMHGSIYANLAVQKADLVIGIGCRFDDRIIGNVNKFAPVAKKASNNLEGGIVHIDNSIDQLELVKKTVEPTISCHSDVDEFFNYILSKKNLLEIKDDINNVSINIRHEWLNEIKELKEKYPHHYEIKDEIKTQSVIHNINDVVEKMNLKDKTIIATGVGNHQMMSCQFYRWSSPNKIISSGSAGVMGAGLPYAIGAQVANPDKNVILIDGDGSFNMTCNDIMTVKRYNLPIKMFIMNDNRQQMVHVWQHLFFNKRYISTDNYNMNYESFGNANGIKSYTVTDQYQVKQTIEDAINYSGPVLVDFRVEPDFCLPLVPPGNGIDEMIIDRKDLKPMEGLAPS